MAESFESAFNHTTETSQGGSTAARRAKEKVADMADTARDKVTELGQGAQRAIGQTRETAAGALDSTASTIHEAAEGLPGGEKVAGLAHRTADSLQDTAQYVRSHDTKAMLDDLGGLVRSHPTKSLIAAAAVGFLVARVFRKD